MLLCCWCCCAGDFVVLVISLYWWFRCADDFVALVRFAGAFVVLVISLRWCFFCAGAFVALVISVCFFCAGDVVVLVVMLLCWLVVSCWTIAQAPSLRRYERTMHAKKVHFPIAEVCARSPRTWIHSGSWLPSCFVTLATFFCFLSSISYKKCLQHLFIVLRVCSWASLLARFVILSSARLWFFLVLGLWFFLVLGLWFWVCDFF